MNKERLDHRNWRSKILIFKNIIGYFRNTKMLEKTQRANRLKRSQDQINLLKCNVFYYF